MMAGMTGGLMRMELPPARMEPPHVRIEHRMDPPHQPQQAPVAPAPPRFACDICHKHLATQQGWKLMSCSHGQELCQ